jgi:hypothetical protein
VDARDSGNFARPGGEDEEEVAKGVADFDTLFAITELTVNSRFSKNLKAQSAQRKTAEDAENSVALNACCVCVADRLLILSQP